MIYENQLEAWKVTQICSHNDEYVKFAFECNEVTTHDNTEDNEVTINSI